MNSLIGVFTLLLTALTLQNAVFSRALDITPLLAIPFEKKSLRLFGLVLTGVSTIASLLAGLLNPLMGSWKNVQYLRPVYYPAGGSIWHCLSCARLEKTGLASGP